VILLPLESDVVQTNVNVADVPDKYAKRNESDIEKITAEQAEINGLSIRVTLLGK
jgi:hypothetical protein